MSIILTMHASATSPVAVDFTIFECYLAGYSVEETVEHLMTIRAVDERGNRNSNSDGNRGRARSERGSAVSSGQSFAADAIRASSSMVAGTPPHTAAAATQHTAPNPTRLEHEDRRRASVEDEALGALLAADGERPVASLVENALMTAEQNGGTVAVADHSATQDTDRTSRGDHDGAAHAYRDADGDADQQPPAAARAPTVAPRRESRRRRTGGKDRDRRGKRRSGQRESSDGGDAATNTGAWNTNSSSAAPAAETSRERRQRQQRYYRNAAKVAGSGGFFLNEDYIHFQHRLLSIEGGPSAGAPLRSELLLVEATEQFRLYELLLQEEFLTTPHAFLSKHYLPIAAADRRRLVEMFYAVDTVVFQYFFGDRMQKFEPIGAPPDPPDAATTASAAAGGLASVGSMLLRWTMRRSQNEDTIAHLLRVNAASLRRQWENIKRVCISMVGVYLVRADMYVPPGVSLLEAIQQCYGIRGELSVNYTTAVFGYHHRLNTRLLDALHSYTDYSTLCNIIAVQWCDQSQLLLDECFVDRCRRIGRMLDDSRVLAELHVLVFGEQLRPRWQVQLDEVQRAITTNASLEKNTTSSAAVAAAALTSMIAPMYAPGAEGATAAVPDTPSSSLTAPRVAAGSASGSGSHAVNSSTATPASISGGLGAPASESLIAASAADLSSMTASQGRAPRMTAVAVATGYTAAAGGRPASPTGSPLVTGSGSASAAAGGPAAGSAAAVGVSHSPFCANKKFSRRFMLEFTTIARHFARIALHLGGSASINDALETFYVRIFTYLEGIRTRTAPAMASALSSSATAAAAAAAASARTSTIAASASPLQATDGESGSHVSPSAESPLFPTGDSGGALMASSTPTTPPARGLVKAKSAPHLPTDAESVASVRHGNRSGGVTTGTGAAVPNDTGAPFASGRGAVSSSPPLVSSSVAHAQTHAHVLPPLTALSPAATVVNTSMTHPIASLLPLATLATGMAASGAATAASPHSPTLGRVQSSNSFSAAAAAAAAESLDASAAASLHMTLTRTGGDLSSPVASAGGLGSRAADTAAGSLAQPVPHIALGEVVLKALDKRYLRELCMLLSALPRAWRQLHGLSPEDHADCDEAFDAFAVGWKAITQVIMAADDFQ